MRRGGKREERGGREGVSFGLSDIRTCPIPLRHRRDLPKRSPLPIPLGVASSDRTDPRLFVPFLLFRLGKTDNLDLPNPARVEPDQRRGTRKRKRKKKKRHN